MSTSLYISSGALRAFQQKLDTTSNNIANSATTGYKRREQNFSELLANQINNQSRTEEEIGRLTQNGLRVGYGARAGTTQLIMDQGSAQATNNPFDLMINGTGFFQVGYLTANGTQEVRYTRDGSFRLSPDATQNGQYNLVNANGGFLLDDQGNRISLNGSDDVSIGENGQISIKNQDGSTSITQRIGLVDIQNVSLLQGLGSNEYAIRLPEGAIFTDYVRNKALGETQISAGFLEGSNVDLGKEMTDLITSQRSFQLNARAVGFADQMSGIANSIIK